MIIFTDKTGQLGNQLFEFSTFITNSLEENTILVNLLFSENGKYFKGYTEKILNNQIRTTLGPNFINKLIIKLLQLKVIKRFFQKIGNHLNSSGVHTSIDNLNSHGKIILKSGSWYTSFSTFYKHSQFIRDYFTPINERLEKIELFIKPLRQKYDILIGLHVRRGDYKTFMDGKFYYDNEIYRKKIEEVKKCLQGLTVGIIICSNDEINAKDISEIDAYNGPGHFIDDMYTLANCDYIIGPPSTFTMWASFYGQKPLYKIENPNLEVKLQDFKIDYGY